MPDENSAADEHALIAQITEPLAALPDDPLPVVVNPDFPVVLRGYDRIAVDAYVKRTSRLVGELQATRTPEGAIRRALGRVGDEVSGILQRAHDTADEITAESRRDAEDRLEAARREAEEIIAGAHQRLTDLDGDTDRTWAERHRILSDTRELGCRLVELADAAVERFPPAEDTGGIPAVSPGETGEVGETGESQVFDSEAGQAPLPGEDPHDEAEQGGGDATPEDGGVTQVTSQEPAATEVFTGVAPRFAGPSRSSTRPMRVIDCLHLGREHVIGCWQVGDVLIDPGPTSCLETLLAALDGERPRALLLTHIHLDHAGASGSLVRCWPELEVYVHERGAPHMIDPARLIASALRLYGEDMDRLWGEMLPVPESNLHVLSGGEQLFGADGFEVAYTPGHASHHVSYLHAGTAFVGDVGGVKIDTGPAIPPTPPPDIDVEAWHRSLELIAGWAPERLAITHFGAGEDVEGQLASVGARLDRWAAQAREQELETFIEAVVGEIGAHAEPEQLPAYTQAAPPEQLYVGLQRYWRKLEG
ncbi:MAG: MBL fold metallo-hydrolase [Solirubrobacteraceae bacterium]